MPDASGPVGRHRRPGSTVTAALVAVVATAVLLAGCAGQEQSGSPAQRVSTWVNGGGGSGIGNVEVDARNVELAFAKHNAPAAIREVCDLLSNDAQTGIGNLPAPDDTLTNELNTAYMDATAAGDDCYNGASGNTKLLARSAAERAKLVTLLATAISHIESVTGQTPTTNTTAPQGDSDPFSGGGT